MIFETGQVSLNRSMVHFKSNMEGIVWPGIPKYQDMALMAVMFELTQSQYYTPERLFANQRRQLRALFLHAREKVPFYAERFERAGVDPHDEITPQSLTRLPVLTRTEYQNATLSTTAASYPREHGGIYRFTTSGTTGRPVTLTKTGLTRVMWLAGELRGHLWHRRDMSAKLAIIRYLEKPRAMAPEGLEAENWGDHLTPFLAGTGPKAILNIGSRLKDQAEWLIRQNPDYLFSYASNLIALAEYFEAKGYRLPRLRQVSTTSEVVAPRLRDLCRRVWGVSVTDQYTCEEAGYLAHQCPQHDHYHVQSENVYLEVVDEFGEPCAVGQPGRVLITSLHNFASPLIRYEVGDYAEPGHACPCGRGLPVLRRILGRARNRLALPDGRFEFAYLADYHDDPAIRQFQCIQRSRTEIELKLVVSEALNQEREENIRQLLIRSLGHPFRVTLSYHDEIPRNAAGKFEEFICEVRQ